MTCFDWCTKKHDHNFAPVPTQISAGYRLSVDEKDKLEKQTGVKFEDHSQYKRWCKENGFRDLERGEPQDVWRREADERAEAGLPPENSYAERAVRSREQKRLAILETARRLGLE